MGSFRHVELDPAGFDEVELAGERLILRRWHPDDAARVHQVMQEPSMREFNALPEPYTVQDARDFVTDIGHEGRGSGRGLGCAVVERGSGRLVGSAALRLSADPEIGYWTAPDARGHGYAAEATRVLTGFAFELGLPRVRLACDVRNLASSRTALRAGFAFEGVTRHGITSRGSEQVPTRYGDLARFGRLADDAGDPLAPVFTDLPPGGLSDGVITLRVLAPSDAAALAEADDELTRRLGFGAPAPTAADHARTAARAGLDWLVGMRAMLAIVDAATNAFAGSLTLRLAGPPQIGGLGYVVHPAFRGRGYTTRALRLLIPWAFGAAGFARLELGAKISNIASQRAALGAGFTEDGIRRGRLREPDGTFTDETRFALLNPRYT